MWHSVVINSVEAVRLTQIMALYNLSWALFLKGPLDAQELQAGLVPRDVKVSRVLQVSMEEQGPPAGQVPQDHLVEQDPQVLLNCSHMHIQPSDIPAPGHVQLIVLSNCKWHHQMKNICQI